MSEAIQKPSLAEYPDLIAAAKKVVANIQHELEKITGAMQLARATDPKYRELKRMAEGSTKEERTEHFEALLKTHEHAKDYQDQHAAVVKLHHQLAEAKIEAERLDNAFSAERQLSKERVERIEKENLIVELEIAKVRLEAVKLTREVMLDSASLPLRI